MFEDATLINKTNVITMESVDSSRWYKKHTLLLLNWLNLDNLVNEYEIKYINILISRIVNINWTQSVTKLCALHEK